MQLITQDSGWILANGRLNWTSDNGSHWNDITPRMSLRGEHIADVQFSDRHGWVLLATDENQRNGEAEFELASTSNSGASWDVSHIYLPEPDPPTRLGLFGQGAIFFLDELHGWLNLGIEGSSNFSPSFLVSTDDGGKTWTKRAFPASGAVRFITATQGWIAGGPGGQHLYATRNGGTSWDDTVFTMPAQIGSGVGAVYGAPIFQDDRHGFVSASVQSAGALVLFETTDGGNSWRASKVVKDALVEHYGFVPSSVADSVWLIAKTNGPSITLLRVPVSANVGVETRTENVPASPLPTAVLDCSFISSEQGWILIGGLTGGLYATVDGGIAWQYVSPSPRLNIKFAPAP